MTSRKKEAMRAGILYFAFVITCMFSGIVRANLVVLDDASQTADLIRQSLWLFRIAIITDLFSAALFLMSAWALYVLLKPVHKNFALLFLMLNAAGVAIQCVSLLFLFVPSLIAGSTDLQQAFQPDQLEAIGLLFLNLHKYGFLIAQIFFGTWLFPLGYLVYRSGFLPKWLGILLMADFVGVLIWFLQFFLLPNVVLLSYPGFAVGFLAEFSLSLWLMIKKAKEPATVTSPAI